MKELIKRLPFVGKLARVIRSGSQTDSKPFVSSEDYWRSRYEAGGNSGLGSYGKVAEFKAEVLNEFVINHAIQSVIEFGCGDGNQLKIAKYPSYVGFDISTDCIANCRSIFASDSTKSFREIDQYRDDRAELCMSLDVIYHLVEDEVFQPYMHRLFESATRYVIVYSTNFDGATNVPHVLHRNVTAWVEANIGGWKCCEHIPNRYPDDDIFEKGAHADFFIFEKG